MTASSPILRLARQAARASFAVSLLGAGAIGWAQKPQPRIATAIVNSDRTTIADSKSPRALASADAGEVPASTELHGVTIAFRRSDSQQADLEALIAAQQNPTSGSYHQWLTPDQFAARFGMAEADLAKVENWLATQGFSVDSVARSRDRIQFSGTAAQVAATFGSALHYYKVDGVTHYAPSTDLTIPSALASTVLGIRNLSDFRPAPQVKFKQQAQTTASPEFTSSQSGAHYLTPKDVATIYDVTPAYSAGYNGVNQSIAVVGQSSVVTTDVTTFQSLAGVTVKAPTLVLVPGTGAAAISSGDEAESDLDLEYTSGMAPGATIFFVYTGSNTNYDAFDALSYAITERIAPILSVSYGACEALLGSSNYTTLNSVLAQAAVQGQTIVNAAGDEGSTACADTTSITTAQQEQVSASFPASSQYVTGMGGTEFPAAAVATTNTTYWTASSGTDVVSSALSYIPEQVWNDDSSQYGLSAGGGGISIYTARPSWQTGVPGIPSGSYRLVPDISLTSSPNNAGYLYCSSDPAATTLTSTTSFTGSCSNGFRDSTGKYLTIAGGTSFAAPVFSGMLALINQARNSTGQGVINPTLYSLASVATTYANVFHDITSGTNACTAGSAYCSTAGAAVYAAGVGYDEASGIGSIDLYKLLTAWPATTVSALKSTTTTLSPASTVPLSAATDVISITVAPVTTSTVAPTGTVSVSVDGTVVSASLALSGGVASYTFSSTTSGSHTITATYSGDATYGPSTGTTVVTVAGTTGSFTLSATSLTVTNGSSGNSTVTVTPVNGYTGTVTWTLSASSTINNACYDISNLAVSGTAPVTTTLTVYASSTLCASSVFKKGAGQSVGAFARTATTKSHDGLPLRIPAGFAFAGLLAAGYFGRRSRSVRGLVAVGLLAVVGFGLSGCGDNSPSTATASTLATTGTFTLTLTGTDSSSSATAASTTLTLTIK